MSVGPSFKRANETDTLSPSAPPNSDVPVTSRTPLIMVEGFSYVPFINSVFSLSLSHTHTHVGRSLFFCAYVFFSPSRDGHYRVNGQASAASPPLNSVTLL